MELKTGCRGSQEMLLFFFLWWGVGQGRAGLGREGLQN